MTIAFALVNAARIGRFLLLPRHPTRRCNPSRSSDLQHQVHSNDSRMESMDRRLSNGVPERKSAHRSVNLIAEECLTPTFAGDHPSFGSAVCHLPMHREGASCSSSICLSIQFSPSLKTPYSPGELTCKLQ